MPGSFSENILYKIEIILGMHKHVWAKFIKQEQCGRIEMLVSVFCSQRYQQWLDLFSLI